MDTHSPGSAAVALLAGGLGMVAAFYGDHFAPALIATAGPRLPQSPDELVAWGKALGEFIKILANSIFVLVNCGVGCWQLAKLGRTHYKRPGGKRRSRHEDTPPPGPSPHAEPSGGA